MISIKGKSVFGGIAFGKISFYEKSSANVKHYNVENTEQEINRFEKAKADSLEELKALHAKYLDELGSENAQIFEIHQMMVEDLDYNDSVRSIITEEHCNAEHAVSMTSKTFAATFSSMDDEYMKERAADVLDISGRIINNLMNKNSSPLSLNEKVIICADDLVPSETVQLDKSKVLAFVTANGSLNSHTAILARTMNIPAIIGSGSSICSDLDGKNAIVDGFTGTLYIEPDDDIISIMKEKQETDLRNKKILQGLKGKDNTTKDGRKINVFANIGGIGDLDSVEENDAGGIGLFRSEFLYLENNTYPDEDKQFESYKTVLEKMGDKKVIIRTLDIGADKKIDYFQLDEEENPALGFRAIRICLTREEIFKAQLKALYRASVYGNLSIMLPMIISLEEIKKVKEICEEVKGELRTKGENFKENVELGIMIETPASVMVSDDLAKEVDFFSVGTNDLTQYVLAADRQNPKLENFIDPHHKAILRMIKYATDQAHKNGKWIGICGELGGDLEMTKLFLAMGIDELSVSPSLILPLRNEIRNTNLKELPDDFLAPYSL